MAAAERFLLAGIMGDPVMHSRSPAIQNGWLDEHGIEGRYVKLAIKPGELGAALRALPTLKFAGVNLTIPHKEAALTLVDEVEPAAKRIGAINLVVVGADGRLTGRNTDGLGYLASLTEAVPGWRADAGPIVVVGAGGGARAVIVALAEAGAREVRVLNRTQARAQALAADLGSVVEVLPWVDRAAALEGAQLLVNTTSQGMRGLPPLDLPLDALPSTAVVSDIVYVPLETPLLAAARARGHQVVDGLGMLLHQAVPSFEALFGVRPTVSRELRDRVAASL
jgi:shikimate dehydrogenase